MPEERVVVREIVWQDVFPAVSLFSTLRLALSLRSLVFSAIALVLTVGGWKALEIVFPGAGGPTPVHWPWEVTSSPNWPWWSAGTLRETHASDLPSGVRIVVASPLVLSWEYLSGPARQLFNADRTVAASVYCFLATFWALVVWGFFGGMITRQTALALARRERVSTLQLMSFCASRLGSYIGAPLFPLLGALLIAIPLAILGLFLHGDVLSIVASVLWPLAIVGGAFLAIMLLGDLFGWPLMWASISVDGTDSFGALSCSYAYVTQRPLAYLGYACLSSIIGIIGWFIVVLIVTSITELTLWGVSWGSGGIHAKELVWVFGRPLEMIEGPRRFSVGLIRFWFHCINLVAMGFIFSYFWTATTAIYFLLRRQIDNTEMDEVFGVEDEEAYGLPPLEKDAAGVVGAAEPGPSANTEG